MRRLTIRFGLVALALGFAASLQAAELSKIDRSIGKQPQYSAKPAYCLLVFGPKAESKAWLVLAGDDLYVDRNGNGDLTEAGKRITGNKTDGEETFSIGDVVASPDGKKHAQMSAQKFGEALYIMATIDGRQQTAGNDRAGTLRLTDSPADAPVIHFDGPLILQPSSDTLQKGQFTPLYVMVGTPGLGAGTFASLSYDSIPIKDFPVAQIEIRQKDKPDSIIQRVVLEERC